MSALILLTTHDCHLCEHGREVLDGLTDEGLLTWRDVDVDSDEGRALAAQAPPLRPVLLDTTGRVIAYGRLSARHLRRRLAATPTGRPSL